MKKICFCIVMLLMSCARILAAYNLTATSVEILDMTIDKPNYFVVVMTQGTSGTYKVSLDVWPETKSAIGSFCNAAGTIKWLYSGLVKNETMYYDCMEDSKIEVSIVNNGDSTCTLSATVQASRNGSSYTYVIAPFVFPYYEHDVPPVPDENPYRFEPTQVTQIDFWGDVIAVRDHTEDGYMEITLNRVGDETYDWIDLKWLTNTFAMPEGKVMVDSMGTFNTLTASRGYMGMQHDDPCYVALRGDKEAWGQYTPYYVREGNLTFSVNAQGDSVRVVGQLVSYFGSTVYVDVKAYNSFYEQIDVPRQKEQVDLPIDTVVVTYMREQSDTLNHSHFYTFNFFSQSSDFPNVVADVILSEPGKLVQGVYERIQGNIRSVALYQNQDDFTSAFFGGEPYVFDTAMLALTQLANGGWQYDMLITDTIGSRYTFSMIQNPHLIIYPDTVIVPDEDKPYVTESKQVQTLNLMCDSIYWDDRTVAIDNVLGIQLFTPVDQSGLYFMAELGMLSKVSDVADGTYPIDDSDADNTFFSSMGKIDNVLIPCYLVQRDVMGNVYQVWYLVSGDVVVSHTPANQLRFSVMAKSYFGSTITLYYDGQSTDIKETKKESRPIKIFRNGQIAIERDGVAYSIMGNQL